MLVFSSIAFTLGLVSSLHCIGMCGPLALAVPVSQQSNAHRIFGGLLYHGGRTTTYALLGLLLGLLGGAVANLFSSAQQYMSIGLGVIMLFYAFLPKKNLSGTLIFKRSDKAFGYLRMQMGKLFSYGNKKSLYVMGFLNGLLPCGMVYLALASSLATGSMLAGAGFMAFFGAGTLPAMLGITVFGSMYPARWRNSLRVASPYLFAFIGALLVLRGMHLGIPFISPEATSLAQPLNCHK